MSAPALALTVEEREVLVLIDNRCVGFSRGRYFVMACGQRDVSLSVQRLRAMKLAVLPKWDGTGRMPVTRMCDTTEAGQRLAEQLKEARHG